MFAFPAQKMSTLLGENPMVDCLVRWFMCVAREWQCLGTVPLVLFLGDSLSISCRWGMTYHYITAFGQTL